MSGAGGQISAAAVGGWVVAALSMAGSAVAWLYRQGGERKTLRERKFEAWEQRLAEREQLLEEGRTAFTRDLAERLERMERREAVSADQVRGLRIALELVSSALRERDPTNPALGQAEQILKAVFPLELAADEDMIASLRALEVHPSIRPRRKKP